MGIRRTIAMVLLVVGAVWVLQGVGLLGGSFMTGQAVWAVIGALCIVGGVVLFRRPHRE
jgi:uncharacterized membrane protein HdeD (DUF308 family)